MILALLVLAASGSDFHNSANGLRQAYQREFAFLAEEQRVLDRRLDKYRTDAAASEREQVRAVAELEARLLELEGRSDSLAQRLAATEDAATSAADDSQLVAGVVEQAAVTLRSRGVGPVTAETDEKRLSETFAAANALLARLAAQREEPGQFFLEGGAAARGTIVHLGAVAAYGVSDAGAGVLAPAGGGELRVWPQSAPLVAEELATGGQPQTLALYLYDSLDEPAAMAETESVLEHVTAGGGIAWVIVALGLLGLVLVGLRAALLTGARGTEVSAPRVAAMVRADRVSEARELLEHSTSAAARVAASVLDVLGESRQKIEDTVSAALVEENQRIDRLGTAVLVIAAVSPLLGLLGTVTGMIATFDIITQFGTGDPKMLSGGISTALITTELGLIVAIPMLFLGNLLSGWGERIKSDAERTALAMLNLEPDPKEHEEEEAPAPLPAPVSGGGRVAEGAPASPER